MRITCIVTNDLAHDRRMHRICQSLAEAGLDVNLVGRKYSDSPSLPEFPFQASRLKLWFRKGKMFYLEFQIRLFFKLLGKRNDILYAVDLDTILPATIVCWLHRTKLVYDAHEYFTEVPELAGRPLTRWVWKQVANVCIPLADLAITVGPALSDQLTAAYGRPFLVIRNLPGKTVPQPSPTKEKRVLWYQGALNQGRGLEVAIESMILLPDHQLWLAGEGDLSLELAGLSKRLGIQDRIRFLGWVDPADLPTLASQASIGLNLLEVSSLSYYYSLANKSFDYIQSRLPAIHMDFPEYRELQKKGPVGVLLEELSVERLVGAIHFLEGETHYKDCQKGCEGLSEYLVWEMERESLVNSILALLTAPRVPG